MPFIIFVYGCCYASCLMSTLNRLFTTCNDFKVAVCPSFKKYIACAFFNPVMNVSLTMSCHFLATVLWYSLSHTPKPGCSVMPCHTLLQWCLQNSGQVPVNFHRNDCGWNQWYTFSMHGRHMWLGRWGPTTFEEEKKWKFASSLPHSIVFVWCSQIGFCNMLNKIYMYFISHTNSPRPRNIILIFCMHAEGVRR